MASTSIPAVLYDPCGSISMERALRQIQSILVEVSIAQQNNPKYRDRVEASLDDITLMLRSIDRG